MWYENCTNNLEVARQSRVKLLVRSVKQSEATLCIVKPIKFELVNLTKKKGKYEMIGNWNNITKINPRKYICGYCGDKVASEKGWHFTITIGVVNAWLFACPSCQKPTFFGSENEQMPGISFGNFRWQPFLLTGDFGKFLAIALLTVLREESQGQPQKM